MMNEQQQVLKNAFPSYTAGEINSVLSVIDLDSAFKPSRTFSVKVRDEILEIPYRIYYQESNLEAVENLSPVQAEILNCLYTRHYNGFIREECARRIIASANPWIPPYILRLLGEYVIEILELIEKNLGKLNLEVYQEFLVSNREFYETTKRRVVSYWDCYYRRQYPNMDDYVGFKIVQFFNELV